MINGGALVLFGFKSSTPSIVLQQIIALRTVKSKFYVAMPCADSISALNIFSIEFY